MPGKVIVEQNGCLPPPPGLLSWWPANGNANDVIGTNNGTLEGGASFAQGEVGEAYSLNGTGAFVQTPYSPQWAFGTNSFTIELWANFASATAREVVLPDIPIFRSAAASRLVRTVTPRRAGRVFFPESASRAARIMAVPPET